ncbi:ATP-binding protein [uncultured Dokdonia sp.]|uniref:sensor histidine kinase n=1 Tax=uncultured Dokdonia sp. TaxID=575653 RepID=UPI00260649B8|nr:ATP-binding protein [uncultured Dokdonia sp.]
MQERNYKTILYFISAVILITLAIQVYWNYKNYQVGKQQLVNDVQTSLDNAVSIYYENKAAQNTLGFFGNGTDPEDFFKSNRFKSFTERTSKGTQGNLASIIITDSIVSGDYLTIEGATSQEIDSIIQHSSKSLTSYQRERYRKDSLQPESSLTIKNTNGKNIDTLIKRLHNKQQNDTVYRFGIPIVGDSLRTNALQDLTTRIVLSFSDDTVDIPAIDSLFSNELSRKNIRSEYNISYQDTIHNNKVELLTNEVVVTSSSLLLPKESILKAGVQNIAGVVLKRNLLGIILSIFLLGAVIGSLLYLLHIIQQQKQLAEIKNDFISNMTHEFKTPIATIGVAMESIQHFNDTNDMEKTKKYVEMSSQQVTKLNEMVEKLLETATINSEALALNKQETNMVALLETIHQKYVATHTEKNLLFKPKEENIWISIDAFHIENALDNVVDNAIKYGGDTIKIAIQKLKSGVEIMISDSGNTLTKMQVAQIFEKFYRVPKGNTHDVKGFGIGLYYTKVIIEKHEGSIVVETNPTQFKILLPYV